MPSVAMRRSSRVFGARVLRSGRRLRTGPGVGKDMKNNNGEWIELMDHSRDGGGDSIKRKDRGRPGSFGVPKQEVMEMDVDDKVVETALENVAQDIVVADKCGGKRWGIVYTRKRKEENSNGCIPHVRNKKRLSDDQRFGNQYFRKRWRKRGPEPFIASDSSVRLVPPEKYLDITKWRSLMVVVDPSCLCWSLVSCFLISVLRYMWRTRVGLQQLSSFIRCNNIGLMYSSCGIHFLEGSRSMVGRGACLIWDDYTSIPLFVLDYLSVPYCFMYLHSSVLLQFDRLACSLGRYLVDVNDIDKMSTSCISSERDEASQAVNLMVESTVDNSGKIEVSVSNDNALNSAGPYVQLRSGRHIQNRRSSLRSKRGRRPSSLGTRKANGALALNLLNFRRSGSQLSQLAPKREVSSSDQKYTSINLKQVKPAQERTKHKADPISCFANVLVADLEKCYRIEGAIISLELSAEKQWHLAIKRGGVDLYNLIAQKVMRPCGTNRITHAVFWNLDNDWKLEFPDKQEWFIFRDIYKKCWDRNAQGLAEFIPVPRVCEVPGYVSGSSVFVRPTSYITVKNDELSRALARRTSNYDMDSEDEEWLNKFNSELDAENVDRRLLSAEDFELVIDAFEKGCYCNPEEFSYEYTAPHLSIGLERRVLEAVHRFWIKKRKQKRPALVKIFQLYPRKRTQGITNSVLRKKRSLKRHSVTGRGKQRPLLQAMAAEQDAREQQNALAKVEEAKAAANRSEGLAILKRQRAQQLMETADLATYKAMMALKITELSQVARSPDAVGSFFLSQVTCF